jgi:lipoyl(octanoyl) transferase
MAAMSICMRQYGLVPYAEVLAGMQDFTESRGDASRDEIWLMQHLPVYTLGLAGKVEHVIDAGAIPVINSDRGGQVTYHGPGQLVVYLLLNLRRNGLTIKSLVRRLEQSVIDLLEELGGHAERRPGAPGVYVDGAKIASLGIRVRRGCSYHGMALNVDMDLEPFSGINPCGYPGLRVTQLSALGWRMDCDRAASLLVPHLMRQLGGASVAPDLECCAEFIPPQAGGAAGIRRAVPAKASFNLPLASSDV